MFSQDPFALKVSGVPLPLEKSSSSADQGNGRYTLFSGSGAGAMRRDRFDLFSLCEAMRGASLSDQTRARVSAAADEQVFDHRKAVLEAEKIKEWAGLMRHLQRARANKFNKECSVPIKNSPLFGNKIDKALERIYNLAMDSAIDAERLTSKPTQNDRELSRMSNDLCDWSSEFCKLMEKVKDGHVLEKEDLIFLTGIEGVRRLVEEGEICFPKSDEYMNCRLKSPSQKLFNEQLRGTLQDKEDLKKLESLLDNIILQASFPSDDMSKNQYEYVLGVERMKKRAYIINQGCKRFSDVKFFPCKKAGVAL